MRYNPYRWCPVSKTVVGVDETPSPAEAAEKTHPSEIEKNLGLVTAFDPELDHARFDCEGVTFYPDYDWLRKYAGELRQIVTRRLKRETRDVV